MQILNGLFRGKASKAPLPTNLSSGALTPEVSAHRHYPDVPVLDLAVDQLGLKVFFLTAEYAPYGVVNATVDGDRECRPILNMWQGPGAISAAETQLSGGYFLDCFRKDLTGDYQRVIADFGALDGHTICMIDIVTFPYMFASRHDLLVDLDYIETPSGLVWKLNHNMLCRLATRLNQAGPALSFFHACEPQIEHNPVHNLIIASEAYGALSVESRSSYLQSLRNVVKDSAVVSSVHPQMDDRYCYPRRMSEDGLPREAEIISLAF